MRPSWTVRTLGEKKRGENERFRRFMKSRFASTSSVQLLNVHYLAVLERHLHIFVDVDLLRPQVGRSQRLSERSHHVIDGGSHRYALRRAGGFRGRIESSA